MKMMIRRVRVVDEEVDVEFPLFFHATVVDGEDDTRDVYVQIRENGLIYSVTRSDRFGRVCWSFEIERSFLPVALSTYLDQDKCDWERSSAESFLRAAREAGMFLGLAVPTGDETPAAAPAQTPKGD